MKRMTIALLVAGMLLSLTACGGGGAETEQQSAEPGTDTAAVTETEAARTHNVPESDFEGAAFLIAYPDWQGYQHYFFAEEETGDGMNDAIWERTVRVEETLHVDIAQENCGGIADVSSKVRNTVAAGEDAYQLALLHCIYGVPEMLTGGGYLYDFNALPYVDTQADWWNQRMMEVLAIGGHNYFGISDYMIPCPYAIYFNRDMIDQNGLDNPYALVYSGAWTVDKMLSMAESVVQDLNGDGAFDENDIWGMTANEISKYVALQYGADQFLTGKDENGSVTLAQNTEKMISLVEKLQAYVIKNGAVYMPKSDEYAESDPMLMNGKLLFLLSPISHAVSFRESEAAIGILPYPKYNEEQADYVSLDWGGLMGVPKSIGNAEMVGAVVELLAFESADTVIPAYYDMLLAGKIARDEDTVAMMDILFDTIAYDVGMNYFGGSGQMSDLFYTLGRLVIEQKSADYTSWYAKNEKGALQAIEKFYTEVSGQ